VGVGYWPGTESARMTGASHGGKGSNRRREDTAKVEANWPSEWNARTERQADQAWVEQQRAENLRRADATPEHPDMLRGESGNTTPNGALTYKGIPLVWDPPCVVSPEAYRLWAELNSDNPETVASALNQVMPLGREHG
jgi:hypothetical protein